MTNALRVPDPKSLANAQAVCDRSLPYAFGSDADATFVAAMREITDWHAKNCAFYGKLLAARGVEPDSIRKIADLARIPFLPANFFKTRSLLSVPESEVVMRFTSSGTTGQKSQMFFDAWSLGAGTRMIDASFDAFGWTTPETRVNYLLYSYESEPAGDAKLGTAHTDHYLCKFAPAADARVAIRRTGAGGHDFDVFGCIETLRRYDAEKLPVRIFGFPAFLYFTLERMRSLGLPDLRLPPDSLVVLGGGWKGHANRAVPKTELYARVEAQLGIPATRVRDSFGAVEHGVPYFECAHHRFHVPVWSRVLVRDVRTLAPVAYGEPGFLQFLTPFVTSAPAHALLMGDLAVLRPGAECGCGTPSPTFEILGRAGTSKNRSCAVAAAELLGRSS